MSGVELEQAGRLAFLAAGLGDGMLDDRPWLTPREAEVLAWVAQGKSNGAIGMILGISPRTVQKHLERTFHKLGVESRTAAATQALAIVWARGSTG